MAHGVKIDGEFLDLFDGTLFEFQLHNPAYLGGNADIIQNSLIFTVSVPNSSRNRMKLNHVGHASNDYNFPSKKYCEIWADGSLLFDGLLTATKTNQNSISFRILINAIGELKNLYLKDIKLPTSVNLADGQSPLDYAKDTALNPDLHDFLFFPVFNPNFNEIQPVNTLVSFEDFQNYYNITEQHFALSPITPFIKLDFLLKKIFETIGFTIDNQFQITEEKRRMVLYNNYDARQSGNFPSRINLKNHVPQNVKCSDFLAKLCRLFNLAPFPDVFSKTVELYPMIELLKQSAALDWSDIMLSEWELAQENTDVASKIGFKDYLSVTGKPFRYEQDFSNIVIGTVENIFNLTINDPLGVYFEKTTDTYYNVSLAGEQLVFHELTRQLTPLRSVISKGDPFLNEMLVPITERIFISNDLHDGFMPYVKVEGSTALKTNDCPLMIMLYRGMQPSEISYPSSEVGPLYPHASTNVFNIWRDRCGTDTFSLHLDGEEGLGANCVGDWYAMLQRKKDLIARFSLSVSQLRAFSFRKKVHVKGMDYFVKSIKGQIDKKGLRPVETEMCTAII